MQPGKPRETRNFLGTEPQLKTEQIKLTVQTFKPDTDRYPDDYFGWITCQLAFSAIEKGNYGIGAILVDPTNQIIVKGQNEVFSPYFRSDRHAEMVVMDEFEDQYRSVTSLEGYTLYTSLEPCTMCVARLITAGVNTVKYVAPDSGGGMVQRMDALPPAWQRLANTQSFSKAVVSPQLLILSQEISHLNLEEIRRKLHKRRPAPSSNSKAAFE